MTPSRPTQHRHLLPEGDYSDFEKWSEEMEDPKWEPSPLSWEWHARAALTFKPTFRIAVTHQSDHPGAFGYISSNVYPVPIAVPGEWQGSSAPAPSNTRPKDSRSNALSLAAKALWLSFAIALASTIAATLSSGLAVFGLAALLIVWGVSALMSHIAYGYALVDPRLASLLILTGVGTTVVAIAAIAT